MATKLQGREEIFVPHPVPAGLKEQLLAKNFKILDARFAPEDYKLPSKAQKILDGYDFDSEPEFAPSVIGEEDDEDTDIDNDGDRDVNDEEDDGTDRTGKNGDSAGAGAQSGAASTSTAPAGGSATQPAATGDSGQGGANTGTAEADAAAARKAAEDMKDSELREAIEKATGEKPAWNASHATLVDKFLALPKK